MTAGDIVVNIENVANTEELVIRPDGALVVWQVKQVASEGAWELYQTDGTLAIRIAKGQGNTMLDKREILVTYDVYLELKNVSGVACDMSEGHVVMK